MASLLNIGTSFIPSSSILHRNQNSLPPTTLRSEPSNRTLIQAKIREIFMPALSSTMTEGKIVSWVKSEGDKLSKGESVVVVESDKADMDVETFYDGYLAAIMVEEGGVAPVGSAIAFLAETEDEIAEARSKANSSSSSASSSPSASESSPEKAQEALAAAAPPPAARASVAAASIHPASEGGKRIVVSPYAKKLAKELKVELGSLVGSGPSGRIVAKDVEAAAASATVSSPASETPKSAASSAPSKVSASPGIELGSVVPFTTMQGAVSRNMIESLTVPTFRVGYTITTDALDQLYKKIKSKGVTMTALLAKATALALVKNPVVNSSCRDGKSFSYNSSINIAVAVAIDGGLITPVLQDADKVLAVLFQLDVVELGFKLISTHYQGKWKELVDKARAKQLQPHEYSTADAEVATGKAMNAVFITEVFGAGTFTLSNLGMFGVDRFDAILPPGTGAIMAVGASQPTVVATKDGRIGMQNQMQVNVTADHRNIYGADLAAFLQTLAKIIEDPKDLTF